MPARLSAIASVLLLVVATGAGAQPACTDAPGLPENVTAALTPASDGPAAGRLPSVLDLTWDAPVSARDQPENAPDAYVVEAGSGPGFADVAEIETLGPVTRYTVPLPNGAFYVRLRSKNACGTSGATAEVEVPVRRSTSADQPNPLVLLDSVNAVRERLANTAFIRVMGQVRNGWLAAPAAFIKVTAVFDGPGHEFSYTSSTFVNGHSRRLVASGLLTDTVLAPGGTGCFLLFGVFPAFQITGVRFDVAAEALEVEPLAGRVEIDGYVRQEPDVFGDLHVAGQMTNTGTTTTYFNEAWIEVTDTEGRVLDCDSAPAKGSGLAVNDGLGTATALAPAEGGAFGTGTEIVYVPGHRTRTWATWEEGEVATTTPRLRALRAELRELIEADEQLSSPQERTAVRDALRGEIRSIALTLTR